MVAVSTAAPADRRNRRGTAARSRHLVLAPAPESAPGGRAVVRRATAPAAHGPRCGCHRLPTEVSRSAGAAGMRRPASPTGGRAILPSHPVATPLPTFRRRRIAAAVVVAMVALVAWAALGALGGVLTASGRATPAVSTSASASPSVVEVAPGDTFWTIARRIQPDGDVRPLVDRLVVAHGGTVLQVGERIPVPRR